MSNRETTYRGIYIDIRKSDICSLRHGLYFYFCSNATKNHFERYLEKEIKNRKRRLNLCLENLKIIDEEVDRSIAINYYKILEKRGFRIETLSGAKIKNGYIRGDVEFEVEKDES